ncbi:MAG: hypothetical protein ACREJX_10195, partial [Polyangiaceae bacterium]
MLLALPLSAIACSLPNGEHDEPNHAITSYAAIPTPAGDALALELEPVLDDLNTRDPMNASTVGRSIIVASSGAKNAIDTLRTGVSRVVLGPTAAFVVQSDTTSWPAQTLSVDPPPVTYAHVTRIDRATLAVTGSRDLSPPLSAPVAFDDHDLIDVPASGPSNEARDIFVRVFDVDTVDAPASIFDDQGYGAASCVGKTGVAIAYEPQGAPGSTNIVSAELVNGAWTFATMSIPGARLDPTAIACTADATRVLVSLVDSKTSASRVELDD